MGQLRQVAVEDIASLPVQIQERAVLTCTTTQLFQSFATPSDWQQWLGIAVTHTTELPYRVGFTRTVISGTLSLDEVFHLWEQDQQMAFWVENTNTMFIRAFAEHYVVTPTATGCVLDWTIGVEFTRIGSLGGPIFKRVLSRKARNGFPILDKLAKQHPG